MRINNNIDFTLDLLIKAYPNIQEVIREFCSIAIKNGLPHPDGYAYIENLFKDKTWPSFEERLKSSINTPVLDEAKEFWSPLLNRNRKKAR